MSAEPRRDFVAAARGDVADSFQAGAAQAAGDGVTGAERGNRQRTDGFRLLAIGNDLSGSLPRQRAGTDRGARDRGADGKAAPAQRAAYDLQQRALAAEQVGAAGDIEIEAVRQIERHQWGEAVAPVGDVFERLAVGDFVGVEHRQFRADRAGIGERQADREAGADGEIVEGVDQDGVVLLGDDDAGCFIQRVAAAQKLAFDAVDGQAWQPQAEDAPPVR